MAKWRYTLKAGEDLRKAIDDEEPREVLENLKECWREIHNEFPDEYDDYELESDIENIEDVECNDDIDYEDIDYLLSELYDYCDNCRIWIEM